MDKSTLQKIYRAVWDSGQVDAEQVSRITGIPLNEVEEGMNILAQNNIVKVANAGDLRYEPLE